MKQEWLDHFSYLRSRSSVRKSILSNSKMRPLSLSSQPVLQVTPLVTWHYGKDKESVERTPVRQVLPHRTHTLEKQFSGLYLPGTIHDIRASKEKQDITITSSSPFNEDPKLSVSARYLFCRTKRCFFWKLQFYNTWTVNPGQSIVDSPRVALRDDSGNCTGSLIVDLFDQNIKDINEFELVAISKEKWSTMGFFIMMTTKGFAKVVL